MCGIYGYIGKREAAPLLLDGLKTLEYRGYDSAGLFIPEAGVFKAAGAVNELIKIVPKTTKGTAGIAHTRWATHGPPVEKNAHPHSDQDGKIWLVHNGIVENYKELKTAFEKAGHTFRSDTDTEVLAHLVGEKYKTASDLAHAVTEALKGVRGTYGIAVMSASDPSTVVVARMGSPIAIGVGKGEYCVASDAAPIVHMTKDIIYLSDGECATLTPDGYSIFSLDHEPSDRKPDTIEWDVEEVKKSGYAHYMLKEIMEAPEVLLNSARGRLVPSEGTVKLGGLADIEEPLRDIDRIIIVGCGSAYYAGLIGKSLIEAYARIPVQVELGSEFRYGTMIAGEHTAVLAVSQSGETADTLESIKEAKRKGLLTLGIVNVVGSSIARETDAGVYNHAGPEVGVASTKAFLSQLEVLAMLAVYLGRQRDLSLEEGKKIVTEIAALPAKIAHILESREAIERIALSFKDYTDVLYIGRTFNFATAYEGALKLKEVSYVHAEGYGAGEMKHGPIAMIDERFPTIAIAPTDGVYEKMRSNIEEIRARKGRVLAIATEGNTGITQIADDVVYIPETLEALTPILAMIPLQLFAYYVGVGKGYNVDRPRNLAKSVTVE